MQGPRTLSEFGGLSFRLGVSDAEALAQEFYPVFAVEDLINLPNYRIYLKLMIDGAGRAWPRQSG
jgi:hypothetical protein